MSHPWQHALSSARRFGGVPEDYVALHEWFDASKEHLADLRHRALRHHSQGIFEAQRAFGETLLRSDGERVPTRLVAEQHVLEDLGWIPSLADWFRQIQTTPWMRRGAPLALVEVP